MNIGRKALGLALTLLLLVSLFAGIGVPAGAAALPAYTPAGTVTELVSGGTAAAGAYSVSTAEELRALSAWVNAGNTGEGFTFYLTADIDLGGEASPWVPIGQLDGSLGDLDVKAAFFGTFDGQGHSVTGLWIGGDDYATGNGRYNAGNGLFGQNFGLVENVFVEAEIHTYRQGGAIAGLNFGTVSACASAGSISANGGGGTRGTGGIVGSNYGTVENCWSRASVHNDYRRAGGIAGYNAAEVVDEPAHGTWNTRGETHLSDAPADYKGSILNCAFYGYASSASQGYSGGIAASCDDGCSITNCYWAEGSNADNVGYYQEAEGATQTFDRTGLTASGKALTKVLNTGDTLFVAPAKGFYPVLFWQSGYEWDPCRVTVTAPAVGGLTVMAGDAPVSGTATLDPGTVLTLTAEDAADYYFSGYTADGQSIGGTGTDAPHTLTFLLTGDVELSAAYVAAEDTALLFDGMPLTIDQLKAYASTTPMSFVSKGSSVENQVTGITIQDLLNHFGSGSAAQVSFTAADGFSASAANTDYSWAQAMVAWEMSGDEGVSEHSLRSAVNGSAGKLWVRDVKSVTTQEAAVTIAGTGFSLQQLKESGGAATVSSTKGSYAVEGVNFETLHDVYGVNVDAVAYVFADGSGYSADVTVGTDYAPADCWILWSQLEGETEKITDGGLKCAFEGSAPKNWVSGLKTVDILTSVTFALTPAEAEVTVKDMSGKTVSGTEGVWSLPLGRAYTYEAVAKDYLPASGEFTVQENMGPVAITLTAKETSGDGSGSGSGSDSGSGTEPVETPKEIVLTVSRKLGKDGSPETLREYTKEDLTALVSRNPSGWAYLFYKGSSWQAIVATELVELDALLADAGAAGNWIGGSYLEFVCSDGVYGKSYPSYDDIREKNLFVSENGSSLVPAGLAVTWQSGELDPVTADSVAALAATAYDSGSLRFVYGMSENQFTDLKNAPAGARSPAGVLGITVVYDEEEVPEGSVGTSKDVTEESEGGKTEEKKEETQVASGLEVTAETEDGKATAAVDAEAVTAALEEKAEADTLSVKVESQNADTVELTLDAEALKAVSEGGAALSVETEQGTVTFSKDELSKLAKAGENVAVSLSANEDGSMTLDVTMDGERADVTVKAALPAVEDSQVLVLVKEDGTEEVIRKSLVEDGTAYAYLPAGSTVKAVDNSMDFEDVGDNWYADAVDFVSSHGLFTGVTETEFAPGEPMTRAMLATVLYRLESEPENASAGSVKFDDVKDGSWYADAVDWAAGVGIFVGRESGFAPGASITRQEMATALYRYVKVLGLDTGSKGSLESFSDGDQVASWAQEAMAWAVAAGLFEGDDTGSLNPGGEATRAEVAALTARLVKHIVQ